MSEIDELEAYESVLPPIETNRAAAARRNSRKKLVALKERAADARSRQFFLDEARRPAPSLPRVKWLERPDP